MKINWEKIRKDFPLAYGKLLTDHMTLEKWGCIDNPDIWDEFVVEEHYVMRHLYDFFDSREVFIDVFKYVMEAPDRGFFHWEIHIPFEPGQGLNSIAFAATAERWQTLDFPKSRQDAEVEAFTEGFNVLENILKNEVQS